MKLLIIGSGAAGLTAAQFARKTDRQAEITVLGNEGCGEYSKCGLPYVIGGVLPSLDDLIEFPVAWFQRFNIDVRPESEASDVDPEVKAVTAISLRDGGEEQYRYDVLLIATGASSWIPDVKGTFASGGELREGILALRTMGDARRIMEQVQKGNRAMIVGSGLIGMEMAEALSLRGMRTYVRLRTHLLAGMVDEDMAAIVQNRAEQRGIHFIPRSTVSEIGGVRRMESVVLRNLDTGEESEYPVDLVIISAGSRPRVEIARKAGCRIGATGAIAVDERCMTSVNNVFAAGDCTEYPDLVTGRPVAIGLGSIGVRQGRVAGVNAAGGMGRLPLGVLNNRTTELFGLEISAVGPTMKELRSAGIEAVVGKCNGWTLPITLKVMADLEHGRIVAAQIVGEEDVHQRINVFAAAILNGMTLEDFLGLETCYAPPAAPTLDPMTLAADAALAKWKRR
jgi:NADH oxidase (H2O2-forming)